MKLFRSARVVCVIAILFVGAVVVMVSRSIESRGTKGQGVSAKEKPAKSGRVATGPASTLGNAQMSALAREIGGLSLKELRAQLPDPKSSGVLRREGIARERDRLLFKRLGGLLGASALDEIMEANGEHPEFAAGVMTMAIIGWMEGDREAAIAQFQRMVTGGFAPSMSFNGVKLAEGIF